MLALPPSVTAERGNAWKARALRELRPRVAAIVDDSGLQFVEPAGEFGCGPIFVFGAAADADCPEPAVACPTWPDVVAAVGRAQDAGAFEG